MRVHYLTTTFPQASETFIRREVRCLRAQGIDLRITSLWKGSRSVDGVAVEVWSWKRALLRLPGCLLREVCRQPLAFMDAWQELWSRPVPSLLNLGETGLGLLYAVTEAGRWRREPPQWRHAIWATGPATAAWLMERLLQQPYSMGAHAYDVFKSGGDWLLPDKCRRAAAIRTSTRQTEQALLRRMPDASQTSISLIRRGLDLVDLPSWRAPRRSRQPLRIVSVGRLVPKKGWLGQMELYERLKREGFSFEARIMGSGPLEAAMHRQVAVRQLHEHVRLEGKVPYAAVVRALAEADVFLFTGEVDAGGDRDGLPNVIPEAMSAGVAVLATPLPGVCEAILHNQTGLLAELHYMPESLARLQREDDLIDRLATAARAWVEDHFVAERNVKQLVALWQQAAQRATSDIQSGARGPACRGFRD